MSWDYLVEMQMPWKLWNRGVTQVLCEQELCWHLGSLELERLQNMEKTVLTWAVGDEWLRRISTDISQEIFMGTSFELEYIWGTMCRAHLFFMSHSLTCLILCMNKQAEYITNNFKIKSVNRIMCKIAQVTGNPPSIKQTKHLQNTCQVHSS